MVLNIDETGLTVNLATYFEEVSTQAYPTACVGHEYLLENFAKVSGLDMTGSDITISSDTMTFPSSKFGSYSFDISIVAPKSQNKQTISGATAVIKYTCSSSMLTPKKTPFTFNV